MSIPSFSSANKWFISLHILDDKGGKSYLEWQLRNVSDESQAITAADQVVDILETLTAGTVSRGRISRQVEDTTAPGVESAASEQIKVFFKVANGDTRTTTIPMPRANTTGGTLVQGGEVNELNPQLDLFRKQFTEAGQYLTLSGETATQYQLSVFQERTGTIR